MPEPIPYFLREEDVDEVLSAYAAPDAVRDEAKHHVMSRIVEIDEVVRTAPEDAEERREFALAEIEDILINEGFVEASVDEPRIYPTSPRSD